MINIIGVKGETMLCQQLREEVEIEQRRPIGGKAWGGALDTEVKDGEQVWRASVGEGSVRRSQRWEPGHSELGRPAQRFDLSFECKGKPWREFFICLSAC